MAYVSQDLKKKLAPEIKKILAEYGLKGSISVRTHSTLCVKIKSGDIDFIRNYNETYESQPFQNQWWTPAKDNIGVNVYHINTNFSGVAEECLTKLKAAMMKGNWDNSDIQTDYFDKGWYCDIDIGTWDKPYLYTGNDDVDQQQAIAA